MFLPGCYRCSRNSMTKAGLRFKPIIALCVCRPTYDGMWRNFTLSLVSVRRISIITAVFEKRLCFQGCYLVISTQTDHVQVSSTNKLRLTTYEAPLLVKVGAMT